MADCVGGFGEFEGWNRHRRSGFVEELVGALCSIAALGFSSSIIRGAKGQRSGMARMVTEQPYVTAFGRHVLGLAQRADSFLRMGEKIRFVFDSHEEWSFKARALYEDMKSASADLGRNVERLGRITFESCDGIRFLPLHAADLLAWEVRKFLEEKEKEASVRPRHSLERLCHSERVQVHVTREAELNPQFARTIYEMAIEGVPFEIATKRPKWAR